MDITLNLAAGSGREPTQEDAQKQINALKRACANTELVRDKVYLTDTMTIIEAIKRELPE